MTIKHILFVDDEPNVLQGLRRMLRSLRNEWEIQTAGSGEEALSTLAESAFDVIVSDMRMPGMDGARLLTEVMQKYPQMVRIVLSGQSDQETIFRSVGPTHQYLSKPCDAETLKATVDRACSLREILGSSVLRRLAAQMQTLPSLPSLYTEILKELHSLEPAIEKVGRIISRDAGMTAKILQLVNSAFFGFYSKISDPVRAINILGLDKIRALVLTIHIFSQLQQAQLARFNMEELWKHNLYTGECAKQIVLMQTDETNLREEAFMAGLLHDAGKLVLVMNMPEEYKKALDLSQESGMTTAQAEYEIFGASHAEVGGYLLGLWGLATPIVEAVTYHHRPAECLNKKFCALTAVHVADSLVHQAQSGKPEEERLVEPEYLDALGLRQRLPDWQEQCREIIFREAAL